MAEGSGAMRRGELGRLRRAEMKARRALEPECLRAVEGDADVQTCLMVYRRGFCTLEQALADAVVLLSRQVGGLVDHLAAGGGRDAT